MQKQQLVETALPLRLISCLKIWQQQLDQSSWLAAGQPYYFLAGGLSLGNCYEARLLWEEGVKMPATAMSTGSFRHGPQEIVRRGMRFCLWIDQSRMRDEDLSVADDLILEESDPWRVRAADDGPV